jgi:hypothetical protein
MVPPKNLEILVNRDASSREKKLKKIIETTSIITKL